MKRKAHNNVFHYLNVIQPVAVRIIQTPLSLSRRHNVLHLQETMIIVSNVKFSETQQCQNLTSTS